MSSIAPNSFLNYDLSVSYFAKLTSIATFTADAKIWELQFSREGVFRGSPKVMDLRGHKSKVNTVAISMVHLLIFIFDVYILMFIFDV